jgi:hypothetical protein
LAVPNRELNDWWRSFQTRLEPGHDPHGLASELRQRLDELPPREKRDFLRRVWKVLLQQRLSYGVALFLLEGLTEPAILSEIAEELEPFPVVLTEEEESHLADLLRILAATGDKKLLGPVERFLLEYEIGSHWASVPWALWPHQKALFVRAWTRFFNDVEPNAWRHPLVVKPFLGEPTAITAVKRRLSKSSAERWADLRDALKRQAELADWLSQHQRAAVNRALK